MRKIKRLKREVDEMYVALEQRSNNNVKLTHLEDQIRLEKQKLQLMTNDILKEKKAKISQQKTVDRAQEKTSIN